MASGVIVELEELVVGVDRETLNHPHNGWSTDQCAATGRPPTPTARTRSVNEATGGDDQNDFGRRVWEVQRVTRDSGGVTDM